MKVVAIFVVLLAVSLAAPSLDEKNVVPEKTEDGEKSVEKDEPVDPSSEDEVADKGEDSPSAEVAVVASSVEEDKPDEEILTKEEKQKRKNENADICRASTGATQEQITEIGEDPIDDAPRAVKCYIRCLAEHVGAVKGDVVQLDVVRRFKPSTLTSEEYETVLETCAVIQTEDPCDSAYLRYSCAFRMSGKKIQLK